MVLIICPKVAFIQVCNIHLLAIIHISGIIVYNAITATKK